jgi:hypothetical protein
MDDNELINTIRSRVAKNPDLLNPIVAAATSGISDAIKSANELAADMETLASGAIGMLGEKRITPSTKEWYESLVISKLKKHGLGKTFCNWKWAIKD